MVTARDVRESEFTTLRLRVGFDMKSVDDFLDRVAETLDARERGAHPPSEGVSVTDVQEPNFPASWWREGYEQSEVRALLDDVAATLSRPPAAPGRLVGMDPVELGKRVEAAGRAAPVATPVRAVGPGGRVFTVTDVSSRGDGVRLHLRATDQG